MALRGDEHEFMNLREWDRRARLIRENPTSRRFSASYVGSFREDHRSSSRTNLNNISSTASSPGYTLKDEIDPSTYSFTNALKALQAKTMLNNREWLTQEGFALNSKWNEAEKYICNPVSGEVPVECLSSKTLRARSFRNLTFMSAPLYQPNPNPLMDIIGQNKSNGSPNIRVIHEDLYVPDDPVLVREKKVVGLKQDVSIQSTSVDLSSGSPSPAKTPPIMERSLKRQVEANDSPVNFNLKLEGQKEDLKLEEEEKQETSKGEETEEKQKKSIKGEEEEKQKMSTKEKEEKQEMSTKEEEEEKQEMSIKEEEEKMKKQKKRGGGCFSWRRSKQRKPKYIFPICVPHLVKGC